jgi:hypothetical protein
MQACEECLTACYKGTDLNARAKCVQWIAMPKAVAFLISTGIGKSMVWIAYRY